MSERSICDLCLAQNVETTLIRQCDFCGRNERDVAPIYQGAAADICVECAITCVTDIYERGKASGIAAATAVETTEIGSTEGKSPVPERQTPITPCNQTTP